MLLFLAAVAVAGVSEADLVRIVAEMAAKVEVQTGRKFDTLPTSAIDDRTHVIEALDAPPLGIDLASWTPEMAAQRHQRSVLLLQKAMAVYEDGNDRIWLVSDALRELLREGNVEPDLVRPIVSCVVGHELTHALQARYANLRGESSSGLPDVLVEGHAQWVAEQVCDPRARPFVDAIMQADAIAALDPADPTVLAYGYGPRFFEAYEARYGAAALWWLANRPTPPSADVIAVVQATLPTGWRELEPLREAAASVWEVPATAVEAEVVSPYVQLSAKGTRGLARLTPVLGGRAGISVRTDHEGVSRSARVFLFEDGLAAATAVAERSAQLERRTALLFAGTDVSAYAWVLPRAVPSRRLPAGVQYSIDFRLRLAAPGEFYQELWMARGPAAYMVTRTGRPDRASSFSLLERLMALPLGTTGVGVEGSREATAVLDGLAPPSPLPELGVSGAWEAARLWPVLRAGDAKACLAQLPSALDRVREVGRVHLLVVGLQCAAVGGDDATLEKLAREAHTGSDWHEFNLMLARTLALKKLPVAAAEVLSRVPADAPGTAAQQREVRLMLAALAGRWAEAKPGFEDPTIALPHRFWLVVRYFEAGYRREAMPVYMRLCAQTSNPEQLQLCRTAASGGGRGEPPRKTTP